MLSNGIITWNMLDVYRNMLCQYLRWILINLCHYVDVDIDVEMRCVWFVWYVVSKCSVFVCVRVFECLSKLFNVALFFTWNTVTRAQSSESKFFRSHCVSSSSPLLLSQNLHPNRFIPRILGLCVKIVIYGYCLVVCLL